MEVLPFIQTALGAGFGAAIVQGVLPFVRDHWASKPRAAYMAIRLAVALEAYSAACLDLIVANNDPPHSPDRGTPDWETNLPELADFPDDDEGWRALDRKLAGRTLGFRNKVRESQGIINDAATFDEDKIGGAVESEAVARGLEAWRLAIELRKRHRIEAAEPVWDYVKQLERVERRHKLDC